MKLPTLPRPHFRHTLFFVGAFLSVTAFAQNPAAAPAATAPAPKFLALGIPTPGPMGDGPYAPQPILPGGVIVPLYAPDSPHLNATRLREAEKYNMTAGAPGRIQSIVNIHNPSIEVHPAAPSNNSGAAVIVVAGGGHRTLNVGTEGADFRPWFYNYGVATIILRNRMRVDGYDLQKDSMRDALQAIRLVRAHAAEWKIDPAKIGMMGFSAGAELAAWAAVFYEDFDKANPENSGPLAGISSRPDFVGLLYPGPTPFARGANPPIPRTAPASFIASAGSGDQGHAIWADEYFAALLKLGVPNLEMHIYGNGIHADGLKDRAGIPFGTWQDRFTDWFRDLGFLGKPGVTTKAAIDSEAFAKKPAGARRPG